MPHIPHHVLALVNDIPNIEPSFDSPIGTAAVQLISWILGMAILIAFIGLLASIVGLIISKATSSQRGQSGSVTAIIWTGIGVIVLGGITGIFGWLIGFNLGF